MIGPHPEHETCVILDNGEKRVRVPVDDNVAQREVPPWAVAPLRDIGVRA